MYSLSDGLRERVFKELMDCNLTLFFINIQLISLIYTIKTRSVQTVLRIKNKKNKKIPHYHISDLICLLFAIALNSVFNKFSMLKKGLTAA